MVNLYNHDRLYTFIEEGLRLYVTCKIPQKTFDNGISALRAKFGSGPVDKLIGEILTKMLEGKLETYTQHEHTKNNYFSLPPIKFIESPPEIDYNNGTDTYVQTDSSEGNDDMATGVQYLENNKHNAWTYKHMRAMLQECWNINRTMPADRFDIDQRFQYSTEAISTWMLNNHSIGWHTINEAHEKLKSQYKARGRPKGSRNKAHVKGNTIQVDDPLEGEVIENTSTDNVKSTTATNIDLSNYVTKPELHDVARNITTALKSSYEQLECKLANIELHKPTIVEIKRPNLPDVKLGLTHRTLPKLIKMCSAQMRNGNRIIPWVYGPAGTGKSTGAEQVAQALTPGRYFSLGKTLAKFEILGFINTSGYQRTEFREAYENGGTFCADEMDAWSPEATVALNGALANGHCAFPDKSVKRHPDFIMIACANTVGTGATMDYVGRNKQDGATLDRFVNIFWCLDEALEDSMCANKDWLRYVRHVRARVASSGINPKPIISPRATIHGEALLAAGLDHSEVVDMCLRKGLTDAQWNMIR